MYECFVAHPVDVTYSHHVIQNFPNMPDIVAQLVRRIGLTSTIPQDMKCL